MEPELQLLPPWRTPASNPEVLEVELKREVGPTHPLYSKPVRALALAVDRDDVLFEISEGATRRYVVVHLTWSGHMEQSGTWPSAQFFDSLGQWLEWMKTDHEEYAYGEEDQGNT